MSDQITFFPTSKGSFATPVMIMISLFTVLTDLSSDVRTFHRYFLAMRDPAMVLSLPVSISAFIGFPLCRTITQVAVLWSAIGRTFCIRLSHFLLSTSDNLGHCHRRCPGSPQPQRTCPGFLVFASLVVFDLHWVDQSRWCSPG